LLARVAAARTARFNARKVHQLSTRCEHHPTRVFYSQHAARVPLHLGRQAAHPTRASRYPDPSWPHVTSGQPHEAREPTHATRGACHATRLVAYSVLGEAARQSLGSTRRSPGPARRSPGSALTVTHSATPHVCRDTSVARRRTQRLTPCTLCGADPHAPRMRTHAAAATPARRSCRGPRGM
jgi:hypothetical protein